MTALNQDDREYPVHCAACLNLQGKRVAAKWITSEGYMTCEKHAGIGAEDLKRAVWQAGSPT